MKSSTLPGWFAFSPRPWKGLKITLPPKTLAWKDIFVFVKLSPGVSIPHIWRFGNISNDVNELGFPAGYDILNTASLEGDITEEWIPQGGASNPSLGVIGVFNKN